MEENYLEEKFTGNCKEQNHQNLELLFFCKSHNVLCCEGCISKEESKGKGEHKNCDIYSIEKIKGEKEINFKDNIKNLEKNLSNFKDSLHELDKIIDKNNEEKEKIKLKIQQLFTKIRNAINKREDELFLQVDKIYEIYEGVNYKESAKLYKIAKNSLDKGKELENEWNNNKKLNYLIYSSINIENNIKDINIIQEKINKLKEENKKEIDFSTNIDINQIFQSFDKIGLIETKENIQKKSEEHWKQIDGQLIQISSGIYGVWGVNKHFDIFYRTGVTQVNKGGNSWIKVDGLLKHISSGESGVWGVNMNDEIFYRKGISDTLPQGISWCKIDGELKQICSCEYGVYGVNCNDQIWFRAGISNSCPGGNRWCSIDGGLKHISVGPFGAWGVNCKNEIWKRKNVDKGNPLGNGWIKIEGKMKQICSGEQYVFGVNENNEIFCRKGISIICNEGQSWEKFKGELKYISDGICGIWGVDVDDNIYYY